MRMNNFSFVPVELCAVTDKQAHYFISVAQRNNQIIYEVNNKYYTLILNEYLWQAEDAQFKNVKTGIYVFKN